MILPVGSMRSVCSGSASLSQRTAGPAQARAASETSDDAARSLT